MCFGKEILVVGDKEEGKMKEMGSKVIVHVPEIQSSVFDHLSCAWHDHEGSWPTGFYTTYK